MKLFGQPIALTVVGTLLWLLAVAHPWNFLQTRDTELREPPVSNTAMHLVAVLSGARPLGDQLLDKEVVGFASEGVIDIRVGGPLQLRYYLTQYALAPTLFDHDIGSPGEEASHEFVFAYFLLPSQLNAFLIEQSRQTIVSVAPNIALTRSRIE